DERKRASPQQARHCYVSLRVFFGFLVDDGQLDTSPMAKVDPPKLPKKMMPALTVEQVTTLLASCGKDFYGVRDRATLLLLLDTGLRAAELLSLTVTQFDSRAGGRLVVMGKGAKQREVYFGPTTATALRDYLRRREGVSTPALFINHYESPLTYSGLAQILRRRGMAAGLPAHATHPHAMRHTFATLFLRDGGNVFALQRLLGHATLAMTERYLTLTGDDLVGHLSRLAVIVA
ncbi:MAG TPA: tyrosine-type recombinase/integrase, partial [Armatimonadota bacterium]